MSRVGKLPVKIPSGVTVTLAGPEVTVKGPKGTLIQKFHPKMDIKIEDNAVIVSRPSDVVYYRSLHGLTRALIQNMVIGVTEGYSKQLEMVGVGYRGEMKGKNLLLYVGYSHPILVKPPEGISIELEVKAGRITISGMNKEMVGLTADRIRSIRKPEPYKGKGIRYKDEHIRRKAGKTAA